MPKCDFNKVAKQVFSCKFAVYFQNTFSSEHLWTAASEQTIDTSRNELHHIIDR